jgi:bifunctional NMN adenylyltransferase/nudix hydrolase
LHLKDYTYNDNKWATTARSLIKRNINEDETVYLTGYQKDSSSYYLSMFPEWLELPYRIFYHNLSSTDIRHSIVNDTFLEKYKNEVSTIFLDNLNIIKTKLVKMNVSNDGIDIVTNAVIISSGHILLKCVNDMLSLPIGNIKDNESVINATLRMINESTNIRLTNNILTARIKKNDVFDSPFRVDNKRTISLCTLFMLNNNVKLPRINDEYKWVSLDEITRSKLENDYFHIIKFYVGY